MTNKFRSIKSYITIKMTKNIALNSCFIFINKKIYKKKIILKKKLDPQLIFGMQ